MSFRLRSQDINLICNLFPDATDQCEWMRSEFFTDEARLQIVHGFPMDRPQNTLIIGTRLIFMKYASDQIKGHPQEEIARSRTNDYVLQLEGAEYPSQIYQFRNAFGRTFSGVVEDRDLIFGKRTVANPRSHKQLLDDFIKELLLELSEDGSLSKRQIEMLTSFDPAKDWAKLGLSFSESIAEALFDRVSNRIPLSFAPRMKDFLATIRFDLFSHQEIDQALKFLQEAIPTAVSSEQKPKFITPGDSKFRKLTTEEITDFKKEVPNVTDDELNRLRVDLNTMPALKKLIVDTPEENRSLKQIGMGLQGKLRLLTEVSRRRKLNADELGDLLNVVRYPGSYIPVASVVEERVRSTLEKQLSKIEIEPEYIPHLKSLIAERFQGALVPNRHPVGLIAAQALGENASQAGLRSFHHAGITGDTGFDRIKAVTDMTPVENTKNPFTSIALKGNPNRRETEIYAHKIEQTHIGDICEMFIGRTSARVPEMSEIFEGSPIFEAEKGGWQDRYIELITAFGLSTEDTQRGSFERPDWIIRMKFDTDKLFQRRISMANIAESIENAKSNLRVIISDIRTGLADVYDTSGPYSGLVGDEPDQYFHSFLSHSLAPELAAISIQGIQGFSKTIVEKYDIVPFILDTREAVGKPPSILVRFSIPDVTLNGIPIEQIRSLLAVKGGVSEENVQHVGQQVYQISGSPFNLKDFRKRLTSQEEVKLEDAVMEQIVFGENSGDVTEVNLSREFLRVQNDVSVESMLEFFTKQNELPQFSAVDIKFDRTRFVVTIKDAVNFNIRDLLEKLEDKLPKGQVSLSEEEPDVFYLRVADDANLDLLESLKRDYEGCLEIEMNEQGVVTFRLLKTSHERVWEKLVNFEGICEKIPTTFVAEKRERHAHRYRILARGVNTEALARLHFVNIYASIPSVPWEIFQYFDIEATCCYVQSELVLNGGSDVGNRHLGMVADSLTYMGYPIKMKKSGKEAMKAGVLATASFQEALTVMIDMAAGNVHDRLVSSAGMTLKGDFSAGKTEGFRSQIENDIDSAISLMQTSRMTVRKKKAEKVTIEKQVLKRAPESPSDSEFEAPEGAL